MHYLKTTPNIRTFNVSNDCFTIGGFLCGFDIYYKSIHASLMTTKLMYLMTAYYTPNDDFTANDVPIYREVLEYLLSRDWAGLKWRHVLKVWEQLQDKHSEVMHNSYR